MGTRYNVIAGQSVERLAALSDGLFAVAMTLLVLDLKVPASHAITTDQALLAALRELAPRLVVYLMSFLTLGIFWVGQQTQLSHLVRSDRHLTWIHLIFLFAISLMPFSTSLMAEFITLRTALLLYWLNIFAFGVLLFVSWRYARHAQLVQPDATAVIDRSVERRIYIAQALYAFGAALCLFSTYWSIGFIILVQLIYVVGPRTGILSRM
ncbi:MAG: TMEM175 family protein [Rhodopila sp.]|nr:TMEM175 family protein [Rhodopila sp.]